MRVVTRRTGLTPDLLRAWERRYGVVTPGRSDGGQRVYSEADIERLSLLYRVTQAGHNISTVANLPLAQLESLGREAGRAHDAARAVQESSLGAATVLATALPAIARLDSAALDDMLRRSAMLLGSTAFVDRVVTPLMVEVGNRWHRGALTPAHEHLATAVVRRVVAWVIDMASTRTDAPCMVVATPAGEQHELGALLVHIAAAEEGWEVIYLGANLPADAISRTARDRDARFIAMSAVYLEAGALRHEIARIAATLPDECEVIVGGAATTDAEAELSRMRDVRVISSLPAFREFLRRERQRAASAA